MDGGFLELFSWFKLPVHMVVCWLDENMGSGGGGGLM